MSNFDIKTIDERLPAPMVAILFWILAGLLVLLAMANAKERWLEVLIAGIGAIGQVAIAVLVWRLSVRQFEFTKRSADEATRTALHDRKIALLSEYIVWSNANVPARRDFQLLELVSITLKARKVFSAEIVTMLGNLSTLATTRKSAFEALAIARDMDNLDFYNDAREAVDKASSAVSESNVQVMTEMTMSLDKLTDDCG